MSRVVLVLAGLLGASPALGQVKDRTLGLELGAGGLLRAPGYFADGSDGLSGTVNLALAPAWRTGRNFHGLRFGAQLGLPSEERITTDHDEKDAKGTSMRGIFTLGYQLVRGGFFLTVGTGAVVSRFYEIHYDASAGAEGPGASTEALWEVLHLGVGIRQPVTDRFSFYLTAEGGTAIITWYRAGLHAGVVAHF